MRILVALDVPPGLDDRIKEIAPGASVVHGRPGETAYESALKEAEVIIGWPRGEDTGRAQKLRWLQLSSAGADNYIGFVPETVILTTANGVHGIPVAEHAFALMLAFARGIHASVRKQMRRQWETSALDELYGRTCGILGLGDIGSELAKRASAFGMRVIAAKRHVSARPSFVDRLYLPDELGDLLQASDFVVNTLPDTSATHHLIDGSKLAQMKDGCYFINVGRGRTVDEQALIEALQNGRLKGAGLDVFETEPLPPESPLWQMENVIVTPHEGGQSPRLEERVAQLFLENLRRYVAGEQLVNVVDRELGY